jgi:hypothetical protein
VVEYVEGGMCEMDERGFFETLHVGYGVRDLHSSF